MKQCCLSVEREAPANPTLRKTATPHDLRAFQTDSAARVAIERWRDGKRLYGGSTEYRRETAQSEKRETSNLVSGTLSWIEVTGNTVKKTNDTAITIA